MTEKSFNETFLSFREGLVNLKIDEIIPNPYQPRKDFDEEELDLLASSIKEHGIIQPVVVVKEDLGYYLVVGERRWRASIKAGLKKIPAFIKNKEDLNLLEVALVENIQRANLNPIEEGEAYEQLINEFGMSQEEIAVSVGKSRSAVANTLRLLKLPEKIKECIRKNMISSGHGRAILMFETPEIQLMICRKIIEEELSVRKVEELASKKDILVQEKNKNRIYKRAEIINVEEDLQKLYGTRVEVKHKGKSNKGNIVISYYSLDDLNRILELMISGSYHRRSSLEELL